MGKIGFAAVAKAKTEEQSPIEKETEVAFSMPKQSSMPVVTILPKVSNVNSPLNTSQYTGAPIINNINTVNQVKTVSHAEPVISKYVEPTISNIMSEVQPKATAIFGFGAIKKQNDNENAIETSVVISNHSTEEVENNTKYSQISENNLNTSFVQNKYSDIASIGMITPREQVPVVNKPKIAPKVCPIDPAERAQCDSCQ
jgi:hypothetical protein